MARTRSLTRKVTLDLHLDGLPTKSHSSWSSAAMLPLFLASSGVSGKLMMKYAEPAHPACAGDVIKISLQGAARVRVPSGDLEARNKMIQSSRLQFLFLNLVEVTHVHVAATAGDQANIDFNFVLPKFVSYMPEGQDVSISGDPALWSSLPSSLLAESFLPCVDGEVQGVYARIIYNVRVQVYRDDKILGQTNETINIYNDDYGQPPTCLSDFPADYNCQQHIPFTKYLCNTGVTLKAAVTEPAPFVFYDAGDSALTMLPVDFELHVPYRREANSGLLPSAETIQVISSWQLKSLTFVSTQPVTAVPNECQSYKEPASHTMALLGQECQLKWRLTSWSTPSESPTTTPTLLYTKTVSIPLSLTKQILPTPSLFTPFITRRYSLVVRIDLVGKLSGKTTIHLEVPVQIVYQQQTGSIRRVGEPPAYDIRDTPFMEHGEETVLLPMYSP